MRKKYSLWQKLLRRNRSGLPPEEMLTAKDRMRLLQAALVLGAILVNIVVILLLR
ncbi:MAG: hypothetical protein ACOX2K_05040 [Bacillota bacterium]|jgi:hypothetical protein